MRYEPVDIAGRKVAPGAGRRQPVAEADISDIVIEQTHVLLQGERAGPGRALWRVIFAPALETAVGAFVSAGVHASRHCVGERKRSEERRVGKECRSRWGRAH